ncbi:MAG TPA: hypothetical protein VIY86_10340, partial [Pirellulaceae bacterium]
KMPWHRSFINRTTERLRVSLRDTYLKEHPLEIGGKTQPTYFQYGLLEFPPATRDRLDREIVSWARSYQVGSAWTALLGGLAAFVIVLRWDLPRRAWRGLFGRRRPAPAT